MIFFLFIGFLSANVEISSVHEIKELKALKNILNSKKDCLKQDIIGWKQVLSCKRYYLYQRKKGLAWHFLKNIESSCVKKIEKYNYQKLMKLKGRSLYPMKTCEKMRQQRVKDLEYQYQSL